MKTVLIAVTSIFALAATAQAAVVDMDTDGDGVVSFTEMLTVFPTLTEDGFGAVDTNGDGVVDEEEMVAAQQGGLIPADS